MIVTFYGNDILPPRFRPELTNILSKLIEQHGANKFYIPDGGMFYKAVKNILVALKKVYPEIEYEILLTDVPVIRGYGDITDYSRTTVLDGIETIPKEDREYECLAWMSNKADMIIANLPKTDFFRNCRNSAMSPERSSLTFHSNNISSRFLL